MNLNLFLFSYLLLEVFSLLTLISTQNEAKTMQEIKKRAKRGKRELRKEEN